VLRSLYANFETSGSLAKEYAESRQRPGLRFASLRRQLHIFWRSVHFNQGDSANLRTHLVLRHFATLTGPV